MLSETDHKSITEDNLDDAGGTEKSVVQIGWPGVCQAGEDSANSLTQLLQSLLLPRLGSRYRDSKQT